MSSLVVSFLSLYHALVKGDVSSLYASLVQCILLAWAYHLVPWTRILSRLVCLIHSYLIVTWRGRWRGRESEWNNNMLGRSACNGITNSYKVLSKVMWVGDRPSVLLWATNCVFFFRSLMKHTWVLNWGQALWNIGNIEDVLDALVMFTIVTDWDIPNVANWVHVVNTWLHVVNPLRCPQ